jgi:hypothetical protein
MVIASIIIGSLALLAAVANIIIILVDKKREAVRRQALLDYINNMGDGTLEAAEDFVIQRIEKAAEANKNENTAFRVAIEERLAKQHADIDALKVGAEPDYQQAVAAAKAVNDFNAGIISILNYDPMEVARRSRSNGNREDE